MLDLISSKIKREHLIRKAFLYIRQSTLRQVQENAESTKRQYALKERLIDMGWDEGLVEVIDSDLGQSGARADGRHGFQYLVSEVSLGHVGIVAVIEASRLSRSSSDWYKLLQITAIYDTLIMDEDGIYNVNVFNDRLVLGLKGTLSEAELHFLQARMRGGLLNKAKRGELKRTLPIGYAYDENDLIAKDPDAQVQEAIALLFNTFRRVGSAYSLVREYDRQGLLFPCRQFKGYKLGEPSWKRLTQTQALNVLKNPLYAGIYVYGKTQIQNTANGRKRCIVPKGQYHAWLPNSHPAYISEPQFDENISQLAKNSHPIHGLEHSGAVREGSALLQGIAICGICGRMMTVAYSHSKHGTKPIYQCIYSLRHQSGATCQIVGGGNIDNTIEQLLLETINPLAMDAAVSIQREMAGRKDEIVRLYGQQMERARYEMDLAKRRYLCVDPDNRLVAAELEYDWNQKVGGYESAKMAYEQKCGAEIRAVDDKLKIALDQLVSDFPKIWDDPRTSSKEKKRIARLIIEDVTITSDSAKIVLGVRFKGSSTKFLEIPNIKCSIAEYCMEKEAVAEIKSLLFMGLTDQKIADTLNGKGFKRRSDGKPYNHQTISNLIQKHNLPSRTEIVHSEGWITGKEKAEELGISKNQLRKMRISGEIEYNVANIRGKTYLYKPEKPEKLEYV
jgi:DNA invertase Pin-like site-specific DNA recombinase